MTNDPVSEAIERIVRVATEYGSDPDHIRIITNTLAALSYARGVEDGARVCEAQKSKLIDRDTNFGMNEMARASLEDATADIRSLIPNEKKV